MSGRPALSNGPFYVLKRIWHDPVWSKVIAAVVIAIPTWRLYSVQLEWAILFLVLVIWLFFLWAYRSKRETIIPFENLTEHKSVSRFSRRWRKMFLIGIFALPLLTAFWYAAKYIERRYSNDIIILIANLDGDDQKHKITETLINRLRRESKKFPELKIRPLGKTIREQEGIEVARKEGRSSNIVLWGFYDEALNGTVHIELMHGPNLVSLRKREVDFGPAIAEKQGITVKEGLTGDMGLLCLLVVGLARYQAYDFDGAILRFSKALEQPATSAISGYCDRCFILSGHRVSIEE